MNNHEQSERRPEGEEEAGAHEEGQKDRPKPNSSNKRSEDENRQIQAESNLDPDNTD